MPGKGRLTRRQFMQRGLAFLIASQGVLPVLARAGERKTSPGGRINLGAIGTGGMGKGDIRSFLWMDEVQVVAVCDVDAARCEEAREIVEGHYAEHSPSGSFKGCAKYSDFRSLISREDIDAVLICTPDHWHIPIAIMAIKAGKDVYCEKPLSLTVEQGRELSDTVGRYGAVFQTGSQQRSDSRFRKACELVRNGRIGRLESIKTVLVSGKRISPQSPMPVPKGFDYDMWLGPAPWAPYTENRCHWNFRYILDYSGGTLTDWGAHHNDIAQWGNGTELTGPVWVKGKGDFPEDGLYDAADNFELEYRYANGVRLECTSKGRRGVTFKGTEGEIFVRRGAIEADPESLLDSRIRPGETRLRESNWHQKDFIECVISRNSPAAPAEIAHRSTTICHIGNIAMRLGRELSWDPDREIFPDDSEANRMLGRAMRGPWRI